MPASRPNFSPYPFAALRQLTRREAAIESAIARWLAARPLGDRVAALAGGVVRARVVRTVAWRGGPRLPGDPHAALAEVRLAGLSIVVAGSAGPVRALAQRLLDGPDELGAPRPLTTTEHAIWALAIAAAVEDLGVAAEVWPFADPGQDPGGEAVAVELALDLAGSPMTVIAVCPANLVVQVPPARPVPVWPIDAAVVVARSAIPRAALGGLAVRDVITVEATLELSLGDGALGLRATPGAIEAEVVTGYVRRDMALPDDAHLELTVQLGTTRLSLRQLAGLAVGQIISLGRPLAGPYDVCVAGRPVGQGELIDVDGELGVRIVSLLSPEE